MYKGEQIVALAETKLKTRGDEAKRYCGLPSKSNYCDAFVSWLYHEEDVGAYYCNGTKQINCPTSIRICRKTMPNLPIYLGLPGDVIFFDWEPNGNPNHVGIVRNRVSDLEIDTVEGNTSGYGTTGVVANKTRTYFIEKTSKVQIQGMFRPQFPVDKKEFDASKELELDGCFGFNSVAVMQKFLMIEVDGSCGLNTVKAWQKFLGVTADGDWGTKTTKATQKLVGVKVDGYCGKKTVIGLQKWLNKQVFHSGGQTTKPTTTTTSLTKIEKTAKELAWPKGTAKSKYAWKGGSATKACKEALKKYYPEHDKWGNAPSKCCSCDVFAGLSVRASGLDKHFPRGFDEQWTHKPSDKMKKLTYSNVSPYSVSKPGDVILYHKNKKGTSKHVLIRGKGCLYEAQYAKTYGHVNKSCSKIKVKRPKVVIFRAK